jgi:hypothetical protein
VAVVKRSEGGMPVGGREREIEREREANRKMSFRARVTSLLYISKKLEWAVG